MVLSIMVLSSLLLNTGVATAAPPFDDVGVTDDSEECPASLLTIGEDLWDHVPELPSLSWDLEITDKAKLLWKSFLLLLDSIFPGFSGIFPKFPDLDWLLAFLPDSWFDEKSLTAVPVISQATGVVIGLVPVVGPILDGTAIVTAKDQITGECISRMGQGVLLASAGATMVFPALLAVKGGLKVGKPLANKLPELPVRKFSEQIWKKIEEFKGKFGWKVSRLDEVNVVAKEFRGELRIIGKGSISSAELADKLGLQGFTENNYREGLLRLTRRSKADVQGLDAHHILPQELEEEFRRAGIENIHDPRLLVWVDQESHRAWSHDYSVAWQSFLRENPDSTAEDVLDEAVRLADEFGFEVLFETPGNWLSEWIDSIVR